MQKQAEPEPTAEAKRGPGRPKRSNSATAANDTSSREEPNNTAKRTTTNTVVDNPSIQLALDEVRASVDLGFEMLHEQFDQVQDALRAHSIAMGDKSEAQAEVTELVTALRKLSVAEQNTAEYLNQWTRVLVELSGADRRRYWRIMRTVYRFARHDKARDAARKRKRKPIVWWQLCLLAATIILALYGGLQFLA